VIAGAAAWGTFIAGGRFETQPRTMRSATGVSVGTGLAVAGLIVFVIVGMLSMMSNLRQRLPGSSQARTLYALTSSGAIVQIVGEDQILKVTDLEGRPMAQYPVPVSRQTLAEGVSGQLVPLRQGSAVNYRTSEQFFVKLSARPGPVSWYYVVGSKLIEGYDNRAAHRLEWLGPSGSSSAETAPGSGFGGSPLFRSASPREPASPFISFTDAVYRLDLNRREVVKIFAAGGGELVLGVASRGDLHTEVAIATTERLLVQGIDGKTRFSVPHPFPVGRYDRAAILRAWGAPGTPRFTWYYPEPERKPLPMEVTKYTAEGVVLDRHTLPLPVGFKEATWVRATVPWSVTPLTVPLTFALVQGGNWRNPFDATLSTSATFSNEAVYYEDSRVFESLSPSQLGVAWSLCVLASFLPAVLAYRWGRTSAFSARRLRLWTVLSFLLGPLALALMVTLIEFPRRETCPACRRLRVVTRDECEHCGEPFVPPAPDGTEIFEPGHPAPATQG
jgi:hypothetical protein